MWTSKGNGTFADPTLSAAHNGADASIYIDTTYRTGGVDYGSGTNDAITVKLKDLLVGDANLDGDVDVWQVDGNGDAQLLSANLGAASGDGHNVGIQEAEALYNPSTGELLFDVGENVGVIGIGSAVMFPGNFNATSIFGAPVLNDGTKLAFFNPGGLPVGEDSVGLMLPVGLVPGEITFSYTPIGLETVEVAVKVVGAGWSDGDFNLDGDVDVWQVDGNGDAQLLSQNLGTSLDVGTDAAARDDRTDPRTKSHRISPSAADVAIQQAVTEDRDTSEALSAALDWQHEYESARSKGAKSKDVEATVDLLLTTGWA